MTQPDRGARQLGMRDLTFVKGHGTENDFVLLTDRTGLLDLSEKLVRRLCDRRAGLGADGVLRAILARHVPGWTDWTQDPDVWFMDYRNADGSVAEMCGNGLRVFIRYLLDEGLASGDEVVVATRAGMRSGRALSDGQIRVSMGEVRLGPSPVEVTQSGRTWSARPVDVGNPHAVVMVGPGTLAALDLTLPPAWTPAAAFPTGVNVEYVERLGPEAARMRVFERGVGETRSCGTGTVAVAAALAGSATTQGRYRVEVPGGVVHVDLAAGRAHLTGPAVLVARGCVDLTALAQRLGT